MMRFLLCLVAMVALGLPAPAGAQQVLTYHGHPDRRGHFVVPGLTWERARALHVDAAFEPRFSGHLYAQPLYWRPAGTRAGVLLVATESNDVHAIDATTGKEIWRRALGRPVSRSSLPCGNIDPLGVTGTPAIDEASEAILLDAEVEGASGPRHLVFALSLRDGSVLPSWPVDIVEALEAQSRTFDARYQNARGALIILDGMVYVPFGGHFGDCGQYRGWVVGVSLRDPRTVRAWATRGRGGGIWAPGGISSDGKALFVATGNTLDARIWSDGEAVFRLRPGLDRSEDRKDFFAASNWRALDERDADLGGTNPLPLDVGAQALVLALGKDGRAYVLDRNDLGGIGGSLAAATVSDRPIRTAPAAYPVGESVFVAFQGAGAQCPAPARGEGLTVLQLRAGSPPAIGTAWCGSLRGAGSPIVTTTDGKANPIVWVVGAEGDNRLHGFKGDTGEPLLLGGMTPLAGLRHFQTLIASSDRLYVGADGRIYAFAFGP